MQNGFIKGCVASPHGKIDPAAWYSLDIRWPDFYLSILSDIEVYEENWLTIVTLAFGVITTFGIWVTAWATVRGTAVNLSVHHPRVTVSKNSDEMTWVEIKLQTREGSPDWDILSVATRGLRPRKYLAELGATGIEWDGQLTGTFPVSAWCRRIVLDKPASSVSVAVHPEAPGFSVLIKVAMRSNHKRRSSLTCFIRSDE